MHPAASNKCPSLLGFLSLLLSLANLISHLECKQQDEFSHLPYKERNKIHIAYELSKGEIRLHVDEFLDTENWNQLIQLKWINDSRDAYLERILIQNGPHKRALIRYKPYECMTRVFDDESGQTIDAESDWRDLDRDDAISMQEQYESLIESLVSTNPKSPYLARVPFLSRGQTNKAWVLGAFGLWLRAQFPAEATSKLTRQTTAKNYDNNKAPDTYWELNQVQSDRSIFYFLDDSLLDDASWLRKSVESNIIKVDPTMNKIELHEFQADRRLLETLSIIRVDYNFDNRHMTSLPIGFNCKKNPNLTIKEGQLRFMGRTPGSYLIELEIVAANLRQAEKKLETKTLTIVNSPHPVDSSLPLIMVRIHEDQTKIVRDFKRRLMHTILDVNSNKLRPAGQQSCQVDQLKTFTKTFVGAKSRQYAKNPINIRFGNGIRLSLDELLLEHILEPPETSAEAIKNYLNRIPIDNSLYEHVFETKVPREYEHMVSLAAVGSKGLAMVYSMDIVRVYQSKYLVAGGESVSPLKLVRILMLVYDSNRQKRLAELRWNVVRRLQPLSFRRRASLFDLSKCSKLDEESMEAIISYPVDTMQYNQAQARGYDVIEDFYKFHSSRGRSTDQLPSTDSQSYDDEKFSFERQRMTTSLNFLRVPKVELLTSLDVDKNAAPKHRIELRATILDKPAPIYSFEHIDCVNFRGPTMDKLAASSVEQCAKCCQQQNCRVFAYNTSSFECKLSSWPLIIDSDSSSTNSSSRNVPSGPEATTCGSLEPVLQRSSQLYQLRDETGSSASDDRDLDEASLAEIHSYLEHEQTARRQQLFDGDDDEDMAASDAGRPRERRSTSSAASAGGKTLLAFELTTNYEPAMFDRKLLVPSEVGLANVPLVLDVSRNNPSLWVADAFGLRLAGKSYKLNALDDWNKTPKELLGADERTFSRKDGAAFFTLRRLRSIEFDKCAQLCYNIQEFSDNNLEQVCESFSYCNFERRCVLAIKTDAGFADESSPPIKQTDLNHSEATGELRIESPDELLSDAVGCNVNSRSSLAAFEGPLRLTGSDRARADLLDEDEEQRSRWKLEWTTLDFRSGGRDKCAQVCLERNKLHESRAICLAVDYCEASSSPKQRTEDTQLQLQKKCHLFTVSAAKGATDVDQSAWSREIIAIKSKLFEPVRESTNSRFASSSRDSTEASVCDRFLMSHLTEYNALRQRELSRQALPKASLTIYNANIEQCAMECSLRRAKCILFEYCNQYDSEQKSLKIACRIFLENDGSRTIEAESSSDGRNFDTPSTVFSNSCHVYLRREFKSMVDAMAKLAGTQNIAGEPKRADGEKKGSEKIEPVDHSNLIIGFILIFLPICVLFGAVVRYSLSASGVVVSSTKEIPVAPWQQTSSTLATATEMSDIRLSQMINGQQQPR